MSTVMRIRSHVVAAALVLAAPLTLAQPADFEGCSDEHADCKETCSIQHGLTTKNEQRAKLHECVMRCDKAKASCKGRIVELQKAAERQTKPASTADAGTKSNEAREIDPFDDAPASNKLKTK